MLQRGGVDKADPLLRMEQQILPAPFRSIFPRLGYKILRVCRSRAARGLAICCGHN
jgi:hypothetical protein